MKKKDVLTKLSELRGASAGWFHVAEAVRGGLKNEAWKGGFPSRAAWLEEAAKAAGYTASTLRRLVRVLDYLEGAVSSGRLTALRTTNLPIGALEILMRMHELAPGRAKALLDEALSGALSYRHLRGEYDQLVHERARGAPPRMFAPRLFKQFEDDAVRLVEENVQRFVGEGDVRFVRDFRGLPDDFPLAEPDLIAIKQTEMGIKFVDGFEFRLIRDSRARPVVTNRLLEESVFRSSFYRRYWVMIQEEIHEGVAELLREHLLTFGCLSVGVVSILPKGEEPLTSEEMFDVILEPQGPPVPDLRQMFISALRFQPSFFSKK